MSPGVETMARPKKGDKKPPPTDERVAIIHLKGTQQFAEWLDGFYRKTHIPKATLVRLGLGKLAESMGYSAPPEI